MEMTAGAKKRRSSPGKMSAVAIASALAGFSCFYVSSFLETWQTCVAEVVPATESMRSKGVAAFLNPKAGGVVVLQHGLQPSSGIEEVALAILQNEAMQSEEEGVARRLEEKGARQEFGEEAAAQTIDLEEAVGHQEGLRESVDTPDDDDDDGAADEELATDAAQQQLKGGSPVRRLDEDDGDSLLLDPQRVATEQEALEQAVQQAELEVAEQLMELEEAGKQLAQLEEVDKQLAQLEEVDKQVSQMEEVGKQLAQLEEDGEQVEWEDRGDQLGLIAEVPEDWQIDELEGTVPEEEVVVVSSDDEEENEAVDNAVRLIENMQRAVVKAFDNDNSKNFIAFLKNVIRARYSRKDFAEMIINMKEEDVIRKLDLGALAILGLLEYDSSLPRKAMTGVAEYLESLERRTSAKALADFLSSPDLLRTAEEVAFTISFTRRTRPEMMKVTMIQAASALRLVPRLLRDSSVLPRFLSSAFNHSPVFLEPNFQWKMERLINDIFFDLRQEVDEIAVAASKIKFAIAGFRQKLLETRKNTEVGETHLFDKLRGIFQGVVSAVCRGMEKECRGLERAFRIFIVVMKWRLRGYGQSPLSSFLYILSKSVLR